MEEARLNSADELRAWLGKELDALNEAPNALERLDFLEDSLAALTARNEREEGVPWSEVRESRK